MILNIGAGYHGQGDHIIDLFPFPNVTAVVDVAIEPLPYLDEMFDMVKAGHILEHIPTQLRWKENGEWKLRHCRVELMKEIYRVLKPGGQLIAVTPYKWPEWAQDPTHVDVPWTTESFCYFCGEWGGNIPGSIATQAYGIDFAFKRVSIGFSESSLKAVLEKPRD